MYTRFRTHAATDPFFTLPDGAGGERLCRTRDVHAIAIQVMACAGESGDDLGGHVFRIGGATDVRDVFGVVRGRVLITDRGRWADEDLNFIYQRVTADEQLLVSAEMTRANGVDLERIFRCWAQPARRGR